jgi:hypothetical protein
MQNLRVHSRRLREIASVLDGEGLRFGLEYVAPRTLLNAQRYTFVHTMAEMKDLIEHLLLAVDRVQAWVDRIEAFGNRAVSAVSRSSPEVTKRARTSCRHSDRGQAPPWPSRPCADCDDTVSGLK